MEAQSPINLCCFLRSLLPMMMLSIGTVSQFMVLLPSGGLFLQLHRLGSFSRRFRDVSRFIYSRRHTEW